MNAAVPATVLVVDDDADARQWMRKAAAQAFPRALLIEAASLREARALAHPHPPTLALVDLALPDGSGSDLIAWLSRPPRRCTCIVSTVFADDQHLFPALRAGASGYLLKDDSIDHLADRLVEFVQGRPALSAPIAARLVDYFHVDAAEAEAEVLSTRERETLTLLAKGLTIRDVAVAMGITPHTAASYAKALYRKLDVTNRAEATLEATRRGLIRP